MNPKRKIQTMLVAIVELLLALGLAGVFFLAFLGIYSVSFPHGTRLVDLVSVRTLPKPVAANRGVGRFDIGSSEGSIVATLTDLQRRVKDKPATEVAWVASSGGKALGERHSIQSFERSGATISFDEFNRLRLGENTLVVIQSLGQSRDENRRSASLVVLGGNLRGTVASTSVHSPLVNIVSTSNASLKIDAGTNEEPVEFRVNVNPDESASFTVLSGHAELKANGRTVPLFADQSAEVDSDGRLLIVDEIPQPPRLVGPADRTLYSFRSLPPLVEFSWLPDGEDGLYHVSLSRNREFTDLVHEAYPVQAGFTHGNLKPGIYYWRVSRIRGSTEGPSTHPHSFEIQLDNEPPALSVQFPVTGVATTVSIAGSAEIGARVFVDGVPVPTALDGSFRTEVSLSGGVNLVVVEALDQAGNTAYRSQLLQVQSPSEEGSP